MKIVLTGGGTAGHIIPNLALVKELQKTFDEIIYIGSGKNIEKELIKPYNIKYYGVETPKLVRKISLKNLLIPLKLAKSIKVCTKILKAFAPDIIFSKGGYVSLPVVISARRLGIKVIAHESDKTLGLANKISKHYCTKICTTFKETCTSKKFVYTGPIIRDEFKQINCTSYFKNNKPTILFVGGSSGATIFNKFVHENIDILTKNYNVIHLCGKNKKSKDTKVNYVQMEFSDDMPLLINQSDLIVTRGGSNAIFEILAINKPMIIVPLSKEESRGDQIDNAKYLNERNLGYYLPLLEINSFLDISKSLIADATKIKKEQRAFLKVGNANVINTILCEVNNL